MSIKQKRVIVYIDGFNFYYGRLKHSTDERVNKQRRKYRWLDLYKFTQQFLDPLEDYDIQKINFYTAEITALYQGDKSPSRQRDYFFALSSIPEVEIIKGRFSKNVVHMAKYPITNPIQFIDVIKTEEKRSDVNLATHLVKDAYENNFDYAIIVTNDSDLLEPIKTIKYLEKDFLILSPYKNICHDFKLNFPRNIKRILSSHLEVSQFPDIVEDVEGRSINRPKKWQ